ncbi:MAG TPA: DUF3857 domain-containing protein [Mucilaginibacter sp.]|nr:DUF3857 domain-containing protein [Mucilaginibacter sp.]
MRRIIFVLCLLMLHITATAQINYNAGLIPKDLLPYASAVVRNEEITTEIKDLDNVIYHVKRAITVLNKNGDNIAHMAVFYDKSTSVKYIRGLVFNEFGKQVGKFSQSDFSDQSTASSSSLFDDARVKHYIPAITSYPYTIEYEYEVKYRQTLYFNRWMPNAETNLAVEKSTFKFTCKPDFNIRIKELNLDEKPIIENTKDGLKTYSWKVNNIKALKDEPLSLGEIKYATQVIIAPEQFKYFGINGSFKNWQELGKWTYNNLLNDRDQLLIETVDHIKEITKNISNPKARAKKVYEYMQQKTHYISIQEGIGGYQPFKANDVDQLNYGDCKALVNYTMALLKATGINSWYCRVKAGSRKASLWSDFASMDQTNHIILCIPFKNDTTWLECTNQTMPFGFLSDFTDDRTVLACTPEGGKLLHTPKYTIEDNLEKRKAEFSINEAGELQGQMETWFGGTTYDDRDWVIQDASSERVKDIKRLYPINNLEVDKLEYTQDKTPKPNTTEKLKLSASEYASVSDGKLYFSINSVNRKRPLREVRNRVNPVSINRGYTEEDEIAYTIPKGYHLDLSPLKVTINKPFGNFNVSFTLDGDKLKYTRKFQIKEGEYSKDVYQELVDFYQAVADADNYNVALVKN